MKTLAILALAFTACQQIPVAIPIAPAVERAGADVRASNASAARLESRVGGIHRSTTSLKQNIATATAHLKTAAKWIWCAIYMFIPLPF